MAGDHLDVPGPGRPQKGAGHGRGESALRARVRQQPGRGLPVAARPGQLRPGGHDRHRGCPHLRGPARRPDPAPRGLEPPCREDRGAVLRRRHGAAGPLRAEGGERTGNCHHGLAMNTRVAAISLLTTMNLACGDQSESINWQLSWSDEFDGPSGAAPDPTKWSFEVGGSGWGNQELQFYTDRRDNSALDGAGNLVITARREGIGGREYTSARLTTRGKL